MAWVAAAIGLGSNLGERAARIRQALAALAAHPDVRLTSVSHLYSTPPWGEADQPAFLNACALIETRLSPHALLDLCKTTEAAIGRRQRRRWGPREIDIDILTYAGHRESGARLTIPHREIVNRAFVLVPLAEIAPDLDLGGLTAAEALARLDTQGDATRDIEKLEATWP